MSARVHPPEADPVWFGPSRRPLLGWLHRPADGEARGGIVICPPVGIELGHSHYVLRCLARELRSAGFVVLRFDYDGTGQSAGETNDPGRVDAWRRSVSEALHLLRETGVPWVAGVGLRLGATLLADVAAAGQPLDAVVLWDPCQGGKSFLREQIALYLAACPSARVDADAGPDRPDAGPARPAVGRPPGVEILGYELGEPLAAELRDFELPAAEALGGRPVLILADPGRVGNARVARRLPATAVEWQEYAAAEPVFDTGEHRFEPPRRLYGQIVDWLTAACDAAPAPFTPVSGETTEAVVGHAPDGTAIVENVTTLGEHRLAAITCAPESGVAGPAVLLVSLGAESSIGPARQWVELSRRWASAGVRSVRFDLAGIGESPIRSDLGERIIYAHEHVEEILGAAAAVSPGDPSEVVLMGVCSGAFQALAAGPRLGPRGVVAVNPILTLTMPDRAGAAPTSGPPAIRPPGADVAPPGRMARWRRRLRTRMPRAAWTVVYAAGLACSPAGRLRPLARAGVSTLLMLGTNEAEVPLRRTPAVLAQLQAVDGSRVAIIPGLDHSLRDQASRELVAEAATAFLASVFGRPLEPLEPLEPPEPPEPLEPLEAGTDARTPIAGVP